MLMVLAPQHRPRPRIHIHRGNAEEARCRAGDRDLRASVPGVSVDGYRGAPAFVAGDALTDQARDCFVKGGGWAVVLVQPRLEPGAGCAAG